MTTDDRKRRGASRLIADAMAEHEVERIGALSPGELAEEMKNEGRDPARARAIAAKALAESTAAGGDAAALRPEAAAPETQRTSGGARRLIEDTIAEHEVERIGALSPEALADEMKNEGRDPARAQAIAAKALAAADATSSPAGNVVSLAERRKLRRGAKMTLWLVAASFAGYAALTAGGGGVSHPPPPRDEEERAGDLRKEAFAACEEGNASLCRDKLDQAKKLDPAGEQSSEVLAARAHIQRLEAAGAGDR